MGAQEEPGGYRTPPPELVAVVDAPPVPEVRVSPDETKLLFLSRPSLPSLADVAGPALGLAGEAIDSLTNGPSRARVWTGMWLQTLEGERVGVTGLPARPRIRNVLWSPRGENVAFTHDAANEIEVWLLDASSGRARRLSGLTVVDVHRWHGEPIVWAPDGKLLYVRAVPPGRGPPPAEPPVPTGPRIQDSGDASGAAHLYQNLLGSAHDEALYMHYATALLARVALDGSFAWAGAPAILTRASPSPDGNYLLVERLTPPFSRSVPARDGFTRSIEIWEKGGAPVAVLARLPLQEVLRPQRDAVWPGAREVVWRSDADASLYWIEAQDGGDPEAEAYVRDMMYRIEAPFTGPVVEIAALPDRFREVLWSEDGRAFVQAGTRVYRFDPDVPGPMTGVLDYSDLTQQLRRSGAILFHDPGEPVTTTNERGFPVIMTADDGASIYMWGFGATPTGSNPFLRTRNLETAVQEEVFGSQPPYWERIVQVLRDGRLLTTRESPDEPTNYYLRDMERETLTALTDFPHPYPQFAGVRRVLLTYERRRDDVQNSAMLYLPAGYDQERDGRLPTIISAYPTESRAGRNQTVIQRRLDSPYQFNRIGYQGALPYVSRGYAVLHGAGISVVGRRDNDPYDDWVEQVGRGVRAAIDAGVRHGVVDRDRVAIMGQSHGAMMVANLLAHTDLFRTGVAMSGAYNKTLVPFGYQREERSYWEVPEVYFDVSPFMYAHEVDEPILLFHGEADANTGTFPMQSRRLFRALKGLGKEARLVVFPTEGHAYRARESVLHMLWETDRWLEEHLKGDR